MLSRKFHILLTTAFVLSSCFLFGQKYSIAVGGFEGLGVLRDHLGTSGSSQTDNSGRISDIKDVYGSFGKGNEFYLALEYKISKNISGGLSVGYFTGTSYKFSSEDRTSTHGGNGGSYSSRNELNTTWGGISQLHLTPMLKAYTNGKTKFFGKIGVVCGAGGKAKRDYSSFESTSIYSPGPPGSFIDTSYSSANSSSVKYSNVLSIGATAGVGIDFRFNDRFRFYVEGALTYMRWGYGNKHMIETNDDVIYSSKTSGSFKSIAASSFNFGGGIRWVFGKVDSTKD